MFAFIKILLYVYSIFVVLLLLRLEFAHAVIVGICLICNDRFVAMATRICNYDSNCEM